MATELSREVGTLVLAAMGQAELSKSRVAELTGIPYSTLGRKLIGAADFSFDELYRIAVATGRRPSDFVPRAFDIRAEAVAS